VLDRLLEDVRSGASRALVVPDEGGVGKTALLDYVAARAGRSPEGAWPPPKDRTTPVHLTGQSSCLI
jgi:hypothetical protein